MRSDSLPQKGYLDAHIPSQAGKVFLITGASSGIGLEAAKSLLCLGAEVIFACRNKEKTLGCMEEIRKILPQAKMRLELYDQSDLASCRALGQRLEGTHLDGIVFNAGIYYPKPGSVSHDGTSLTFHVNAHGTYALFLALKDAHPKAKYVFVTSPLHERPEGGYASYLGCEKTSRGHEYAVTKEYNRDLCAYAVSLGFDAVLAHPGVSGTAIFHGFPPAIRKAGHVFLYLFTHKPWKACLGEVMALTSEKKEGVWLYLPRGPFGISGYPKAKKLSREWRDPRL